MRHEVRRCLDVRRRAIRFVVVRIGPKGSATMLRPTYESPETADKVRALLDKLAGGEHE